MANVELLKEKMKTANISTETLAKKLGINRATMYRRLAKNGENFSIKEANIIKEELSLTRKEANVIFFTNESHICELIKNQQKGEKNGR